jgi:hypothetical protein
MIEPAIVPNMHFAVGSLAVLAGFTAFLSPKGGTLHRAAGKLFFGCMLLLCASGLWMSLSRSILFTVCLTGLAFHATLTGWAAASHSVMARRIEMFSIMVVFANGLGAAAGGYIAAQQPTGMLDDLPSSAFYVLAMVSLIMLFFDLRHAGIDEKLRHRRIARHAGRMGFSMLIATTIFFFGNNHVLPDVLRSAPILAIPVAGVLALTLGYQALVLFRRRFSARRV